VPAADLPVGIREGEIAVVSHLLYRHTGVVWMRATTDPGGLALPENLDWDADHAVIESGRAWLAGQWQRDEVQAALRVASPALSRQIDDVLNDLDGHVRARQVRRVIAATCSYLLRWQRRPTPFGLFAGVATASVASAGQMPSVWFGHDHRVVARADAQWLAGIIDHLECDLDVLPRLPVVINNVGFVRAERFVVPMRPDDAALSRGASQEISIRLTRPVRAALAAATEPIRFGELAERLHAQFPAAPTDAVQTVLTELVHRHVLLTSLHAPMTTVDALAHLVDQLDRLDTADLPEVAGMLKELTAIHDDLAHLDRGLTPAESDLPIEVVAERMRTAVTASAAQTGRDDAARTVIAIDVELDCRIIVPDAAVHEAEAAVTALLRLTPNPFGAPQWKDWHLRFRDRYGAGAVVPVRDVVADSGLGYPAGFLDASRRQAARVISERDAAVLALLQQAAVDGRTEIELTESTISELSVGDPDEMIPPPRVELAFQLHAASLEALAEGQFELWVTGAPSPASSMAGRFAHLLSESDRRHLADTYTNSVATGGHAVAAQLSFPPRRRHNENITRTPQVLSSVLPLSEHRGAGQDVIELDDLAVTADATQLYLVQLSTGRLVQPQVLHALEASVQTPPLARFLAELSSARCGVYGPFDFGAARTLPFLPRVRRGRAVLFPARWLLEATAFPAGKRPLAEWEMALSACRTRWRVPSTVLLCQAELRLPLDLDDRLHRILLRTRLDRAGRIELRETGDQRDLAWAGRACELLVPLVAIHRRPGGSPTVQPRPVTVARADVLLAGHSAVLHAQLFGHPVRFNEILTDHVPALLDNVAQHTTSWWFHRRHDTARPDSDHHLAVYLRLHDPEDYGTVAALLARWAGRLRDHGLLAQLNLAAYQPQTGRYGHGLSAAAEEAFAADSAAALAEITMATTSGQPGAAITAASLTDLAAGLAGTPRAGWRWLIDLLPQDKGKLDRSWRDATMLLIASRDGRESGTAASALRAQPGGQHVVAAWDRRREALAAYRDQLAQQRDPQTVLRSLLHDHHVRVLGVDPEREQVVNRLARAAALRQIALNSRRMS
jgi:thiopeptide-type bacteriocin biosynthesis protein